jgi:hypothetical protein
MQKINPFPGLCLDRHRKSAGCGKLSGSRLRQATPTALRVVKLEFHHSEPMPDYQIVLTSPDHSLVSSQVSAAPSLWDEFLPFSSVRPPAAPMPPPSRISFSGRCDRARPSLPRTTASHWPISSYCKLAFSRVTLFCHPRLQTRTLSISLG